MNTKEKNNSTKRLEINSRKLSEMGGEYILSAVEIKNYNDISLSFEKLFYDNNSAWDIYLYKIKSND